MSLARIGCDGSDCSVYECDGGLVCAWCLILSGYQSHVSPSAAGMLEHLQEHRQRGHGVPQSALDELERRALGCQPSDVLEALPGGKPSA